jgi:hypothetical protein
MTTTILQHIDPNDIIDRLLRMVDLAEINPNSYQFTDIRRTLNTTLRQAIDEFSTSKTQEKQDDRDPLPV